MDEASMMDVVKALYAGLNRNDIPAVMRLLDPAIYRIEWEGTASEGAFRGLAEVEAHFRAGRDTWAEGGCEPERMLVAGDKVLVFVHVRVRLKDRDDWIDGRVVDGFLVRGGRIVEFRSFFEEAPARAWAGIAGDLA